MNSRLQQFIRIVWVLTLTTFMVSCQDTIPHRQLIRSSSVSGPNCTPDQDLVEEIVDGEIVESCKDKVMKRPDNAVKWNSDFCICKDNKALSYGNCSTFCSSKATNGAEILYATFNLGTEILLNKNLGNLYNWCLKPFETDEQNPACVIQAKDESGAITTINDITISASTNSITTNVQNILNYDKTYVLTLVEKNSGSKSDSVQTIKFSQDLSLPILGPLKNVPVSQYSCIVRDYSEDSDGNIYYNSAYRVHYYFIPRLAPDKVPANFPAFICHDIFNPAYGMKDQDNYPRLETIPGVITLWDQTDPRFYDNNGNKLKDINEAIVQKTKNFGATIPASSEFFFDFKWLNSYPYPDAEGKAIDSNKLLGYIMAPWIDQSTFKSYCLNNTHYNSTNPLFRAFRDYVGVETEGLYVGVKSAEEVINSDGESVLGLEDRILIRETDLKAVWFYLKNNVPTAPTDDNVANNTIFFYYPLNKASPFVRTSSQKLFKVKSAQELNTARSGSTPSGDPTSYPPHDRKIGCIPKP